ncbi:MAG TPA: M48 family metallopeptidase [Verrucomicrobiae bacterium]|jgi:STE24 endopeptidase|nr:M48 family metallopeptidase [Verrucomicrobiae bacterium]
MISIFAKVCGVLIAAKWCAQMALEWVNQKHVKAHASVVPAAFVGTITPANYAKSVEYTLVKGRFEMIELTWNAVVLAVVLFSGVLPWFYRIFPGANGPSVWAGAAYLVAVGILLAAVDLPFEWHAQFHIEERFGFNTTTAATWWMDRVKGLLLTVALGYPLLVLILKLAVWLGAWWWFWAWVCLAVFQLVMMLVAPVLIMPLFNKFTALPAGALRDALMSLGERAGFRARDIQVMDGSKRSRHSNAFFTGLGRFRKIVLFDTLVEQLDQAELESVLAHEIGHYKKGHIPKTIALSLGGSLLGFYIISALAKDAWFLGTFGFAQGNLVPVLLLISLLSGAVTFWLSPLFHLLSRRHEYEADAFAAELIKRAEPLIAALRKLNEKNLSNLTPHPFYSGFYYSHPTLVEREAALKSFSGR